MRPPLIRCVFIGIVIVLISAGCANPGAAPTRATVAPIATATFEPLQTVTVDMTPALATGSPVVVTSATEAPAGPSPTPALKPGRGFLGVSVAATAPAAAANGVLAGLKGAGIKAEQVVEAADLELVGASARALPSCTSGFSRLSIACRQCSTASP